MPQISLFTPGPTHIPDEILRAMHSHELHHRTPEFRRLFQDTREQLAQAMHSPVLPLFLSCSGTGGMEAVVLNSVGPSDTLGYLDAGKFGERWGQIAESAQLRSKRLQLPWGESATTENVISFLEQSPEITHFALQFCETSTTVEHDVTSISQSIKERFPHIILIIDAISSAATVKWDLNAQHWDAVITASQKSFMVPPGLTMLFLSPKYWDSSADIKPRTLYFDLKNEYRQQTSGNAAWTPAISLIAGLKAALSLFEREGWENVYTRHKNCRNRALFWFSELGFSPINVSHGAHSVSGARPPLSINAEKLRSTLKSRFQIQVAGGQDEWKGEVVRIGHMGIISSEDIDRCFLCIQQVINQE
ncbi:alanine--glyoxylate aminotransferase family protein [bacterium]|nr:alanine--glyoxylate aminotransferase family protein [bacterium]